VCVRVTDMRGVDLARTPFDFDLTFALLLMHPDGHVYHRYGGRDERGAGVWLSEASLERLLTATLAEHEAYSAEPAPPERRAPLRLEDVPSFQKRDKGECIHCHNVFPALYEEARDAGRWSEDDRWVHPPPGRIGLDLERDDQRRVVAVGPGSPAERAGLAAGDVLLRAGGQQLLTSSDLSQALHDLGPGPATLALLVERGGEPRELALELAPGWKRGTPLEFSWRPFKWGFTPEAGFGGRALGADEKRELGLAPEDFAFRVTYLATWGERPRFGKEASRAGLREGDVFLAAAGQRDFASLDHFHAWWCLTRTPGERIPIEILRDGERRTVELEVLR
jgi:membrane-associated protease RseP (regulator of RpoE activity)